MSATIDAAAAEAVERIMKSRRVVRAYTGEPVADDVLRRIVETARWAASAGNRHLHKFLIVRDPETIRLVRAASPGMLADPAALVVILVDSDVAAQHNMQLGRDRSTQMDVGTSAMNMLNMAHALGIGACPVTSFSHAGVAAMLALPANLEPHLILMLGQPLPGARAARYPNAPKPLTARDLTYWEEAGRHDP
jgi:nitroreductase